jgi:hypothetical protein
MLIPKLDGGLRPVALFRTIYRILGHIRVNGPCLWAERHRGPVFDNSGGRRVGDAAWREQLWSSRDSAGVSIEFLADSRKAFERVDRGLLVALGLQQQCPANVLAVS